MTLSFQTQINGKPNYFIAKIWMGIPGWWKHLSYDAYWEHHVRLIGKPWDVPDGPIQPKVHTIREDTTNRWRPGMKIHFVINNRQVNRFRFAPVAECISVQEIKIQPFRNGLGRVLIMEGGEIVTSYMPFKGKGLEELTQLAINDGFDSVEEFFAYFNQDFKGKLIHWTDLKY